MSGTRYCYRPIRRPRDSFAVRRSGRHSHARPHLFAPYTSSARSRSLSPRPLPHSHSRKKKWYMILYGVRIRSARISSSTGATIRRLLRLGFERPGGCLQRRDLSRAFKFRFSPSCEARSPTRAATRAPAAAGVAYTNSRLRRRGRGWCLRFSLGDKNSWGGHICFGTQRREISMFEETLCLCHKGVPRLRVGSKCALPQRWG